MTKDAQEKPKVGPEVPVSDGDVPSLPSPTVGIRPVRRHQRETLQGCRSVSEQAFEAGWNDGYGDGYVDGYDDGQYNQLIGLIRELDDWMTSPIVELNDVEGIYSVILYLRGRLEDEP